MPRWLWVVMAIGLSAGGCNRNQPPAFDPFMRRHYVPAAPLGSYPGGNLPGPYYQPPAGGVPATGGMPGALPGGYPPSGYPPTGAPALPPVGVPGGNPGPPWPTPGATPGPFTPNPGYQNLPQQPGALGPPTFRSGAAPGFTPPAFPMGQPATISPPPGWVPAGSGTITPNRTLPPATSASGWPSTNGVAVVERPWRVLEPYARGTAVAPTPGMFRPAPVVSPIGPATGPSSAIRRDGSVQPASFNEPSIDLNAPADPSDADLRWRGVNRP